MFGNSLNQPDTLRHVYFEHWLGCIGPLEAETGLFFASGWCVKAGFEMLEPVLDMDRFNYVWKQSKLPGHPLMWAF